MWLEVPAIRPPAGGVKTANTQGLEQRLTFQQRPIRTAAKGIGHYPARLMIECLPQPPRVSVAPDKRPPLGQLRLLHCADLHRTRRSFPSSHQRRSPGEAPALFFEGAH